MKNSLRRRFLYAVNSILEELDFEELDRSCNGKDPSYAQEILQQMHQAFLNIYRTDCLTDQSLTLVELPAVIRGKRTGEVTLGLVTLDMTASGGRWDTVFITPVGVLRQNQEKMSRIQRTYLLEKFMPYHITALIEYDLEDGMVSTCESSDNHWLTYKLKDVATAAFYAERKFSIPNDTRREIFETKLQGKEIEFDEQTLADDSGGPAMTM